MELTKEQTFQIHLNTAKSFCFDSKYKVTTKTEWHCLGCLSKLYVGYKAYGINRIFCPECFWKYQKKPTIAQLQYVRILKDRQLKLIESHIDRIESENLNNEEQTS